jgi:hypothetical protein
MANTAVGRTETAILTNKSGGSVALGDVVVIDTANAAAFTTNTAGAFTSGRIGVVLEPNGIANNASGLVAFSGYVSIINLSGTGSIGDLVKTHTVAKQGVRHASPQISGDFAQALGTSATPVALLFGAVQLGLGTGVPAGTSFPGSPATNDLYFRTDRSLLYFYDGTRWLTLQEYAMPVAIQDTLQGAGTGTPQTLGYMALDNGTYDLYVTRIACSTTIITTNSGVSYWTITFARQPSATSLGSFNTSADTVNVNTRHTVTVNALAGTSDRYVTAAIAKTGTPGAAYVISSLFYRMVG